MARGPEDHFTDSRELYALVEGDEWAHVEALDLDAGYGARLDEVKAYAGHVDIATTQRYVHHVPQYDAADRLSAVVAAAAHPDVHRTGVMHPNSAQLSNTESTL